MAQKSTPKPKRTSKAFRDLNILFIISLLVFLWASVFHIFVILAGWSRKLGIIHADEIFTVMIFLSIAFGIYAFRRWRELQQEIHERQKAEEEINKLNRELEQRLQELSYANKELEAFNYSVSHDLRSPLMLIGGYSQSLLKHHARGLNANAIRYLEIIRNTTHKMEQLIDGLLQYSQSGRQVIRQNKINCQELVREIAEDLYPFDGKLSECLKVHELPEVHGDRILLRQVFTNLLSNAIKYSSLREKPFIEIGGWRESERIVIFVRDNGAGFDMQEAHKLFTLFERLHKPEEFEGNGVGLSIVQRIILRHGGEIWAEGRKNEGATFYIALPVNNKD